MKRNKVYFATLPCRRNGYWYVRFYSPHKMPWFQAGMWSKEIPTMPQIRAELADFKAKCQK